jgi:AcrR family transcriptional regulator
VAGELFVAKGYAGATIADVATAAQVSQPTVYGAFGSKAGLLRRCIEVALAGDDEQRPVADRPLAQWVHSTDDPRALLARYATMMVTLARRAAPIYDVLVRAADTDPELAELLADFERQRLRAATMVAEGVAERGGLAPGTTVSDARDVVWTLNAPELYVTLTRKRRWSQRRYEAWARDALIKLLTLPVEAGEPPPPDAHG